MSLKVSTSGIKTLQAGTGISIDATNPKSPIISNSTDLSGYVLNTGNPVSVDLGAFKVTATEFQVGAAYPIKTGGNNNEVWIGAGAGNGVTTGAAYSIFIGDNAGSAASTAYNANFLGLNAGYNASNAYNANFLGSGAGYGATSANNANFLGNSAGNGATDTNNANFLGNSAGNGATNASDSNYLGSGAGYLATNANNANFLGNNAGNRATHANNANYLGANAGYGATGAYNANYLGANAGYGATGAYNANYLGANAGFGAANAYNANFLGLNAGYNATNASNSIFIGTQSGYSDTVGNATNAGDWSIAIGPYSGTGGFSNSMAFGRGVKNSATLQANFGNTLFLEGIYNSDSQSSTPTANNVVIGGATNAITATGKIVTDVSASANNFLANLGAVATPSYSFTGDLNTGMYSPADDTVAISTNGLESFRINSSQNIVMASGKAINFTSSLFEVGNTNTAPTAGTHGSVFGTNNTLSMTGTATRCFAVGDSNAVTVPTGGAKSGAFGVGNTVTGNGLGSVVLAIGADNNIVGGFGIGRNNTNTTSNAAGHVGVSNSGTGFTCGVSNAAGADATNIAIGNSNTCSNSVATAIGRSTTASGFFSTVIGNFSTASGSVATAIGFSATASGGNSLALGKSVTASASDSAIVGWSASAVTNSTASSLMIAYEGNQTLMTASNTTFNQNITFADTRNIVLNTTTGTKIGTATSQKLGFHDSAPTIQRAGAAQVAVATTAATNTTPFGFTTAAQADAIITLLNEMRAAMVEKGLIKGTA